MHLIDDTILLEFEHLFQIANSNIEYKQNNNLTVEQFLQLCLDIRNASRGEEPNLSNKNFIQPERNIIQ